MIIIIRAIIRVYNDQNFVCVILYLFLYKLFLFYFVLRNELNNVHDSNTINDRYQILRGS